MKRKCTALVKLSERGDYLICYVNSVAMILAELANDLSYRTVPVAQTPERHGRDIQAKCCSIRRAIQQKFIVSLI